MKNIETEYFGPPRRPWQILSGTGIKIAGIILMTMDHLHQMFIAQGAPNWLNWFGRPVAVMFVFLSAEGFFYTHHKWRYMLQFLTGFLFMSAMNLTLSTLMPMEYIALINNIFGTLFMAAFYMWNIDRIRDGLNDKNPAKILGAIGGFLLPFITSLAVILAIQSENRTVAMISLFIPDLLSVEGGFALVLLGAAFYVLRKYRFVQAVLVLAVSALSWYFSKDSADLGNFQWLMVFAVIPILLYNGKRGKGIKYFFYIFYPAHIYILYCAAWFLRG
ncbi:MAG: conjugal transfer protein TraX [Treponema sp.]|nr:conjugal transfer protein TraX [Treponema sp.]